MEEVLMKPKHIIFAVALLFAFTAVSFAEKDMVVTKSDDTKIYQNQVRQLYEKPIYTAKANEYMEVLETTKDLYKVKLSSGKVGWVEKRFVGQGKDKRQVNYTFDAADVQGWLDNPQAVYILDMTDPNFKPIKLDKSFADKIEENVDRENSEEMHGMYRPQSGGAGK
jgi:hypothetical protein